MSMRTNGSIEHSTHLKGNEQINTTLWTIPNFRSILRNKDLKGIQSTIPISRQPTTKPWKLQLMMQFLGEERQWIGIYYSTSKSDVLNSVRLNIIFESWDISYSSFKEHRYEVTSTTRQIVEAHLTHLSDGYVDIDDLISEYDCSTHIFILMNNGTLRLSFKFVFTIEDDKQDPSVSISSQASTPPPETQMTKDLENLFIDSIYSDVSMKSADDEEFKVHKGMLASRSPVLKAHFEHNFTESITNVVESPLESGVLREVLSFIYTDKASKVDEFPEKLLAAADYYQLSELKIHCGDALQKKLTIDNAIEILQLADIYSANTLKQRTLDFIKYDGQFSQIIKTEGWNKLQSVDLIKEICDNCN